MGGVVGFGRMVSMVMVVEERISAEQLRQAKEEYGEYVKLVVDMEKGVMTAGGEWHADGEQVLLKSGSKQADLWGGGVNLETREVDFNSLINIRPGVNESMELMDQELRERMRGIINRAFQRWLRQT